MRQRSVLMAAIAATVACSVSHAQVVFSESFDDGLAASRFTVNKLIPATGSNTETVNFAFDYTATTYDSYTSPTDFTAVPIPLAPGSDANAATKLGLKMQLSGLGSHLAAIPNGVTVSGDFRIEGYMWGNYNGGPGDGFATQGGTGSTEYITTGLNRTGTTGVAGIFPTGATPASGYDFSMAMEGGQSSDMRISTTDAGDDGAGFMKRNAAWPGAITENRFNLTTGDLILTGAAGAQTLVKDTPDNHANSYTRTEVFPGSQGFEVPGAPAKKWVPFIVEQHGRISSYVVNGKVISVLFNNAEDYAGAPQFGYADRNSGVAADAGVKQFAIFDNLKATQLPDATQNAIAGGNDFAELKASGTYPVSSATALTGLVIDIPTTDASPATTISGAGPLNFAGTYGAILASRGTHNITAPVNITADTAIMVGPGGTGITPAAPPVLDPATLNIANATYATTTDLTKNGFGTLSVNRLRAKSLTNSAGLVKITGAGPSSAGKLNAYTTYDIDSAAAVFNPGATLDLGRTVLAIDYVGRNSTQLGVTNSPLIGAAGQETLGVELNAGFNVDPVNTDPRGPLPLWTGRGITTSAPEVVGTGFYDSAYVVRLFEASVLGYTSTPSNYGTTGLQIDDTTVLVGFTFKADFNFDQIIDFNDLVILAQNYNQSDRFWYQGNATADGALGAAGAVDFNDLVLLAQNYGKTVGAFGSLMAGTGSVTDPTFAHDWALAQSLVPEPTSLALLGLGASAMIRRRR